MADQAYERGLETREEMLGSEHGRTKVENADEFTRERIRDLMTRVMPDCGIQTALDSPRHPAALLEPGLA